MKTRDIFKKNLNKLLNNNDMSVKQLSDKLKIPYTTMIDWKKGNHIPRADKIDKICEIFNIKPYDLFYGDE